MKILTGASGYNYKEWRGDFYPRDVPANNMLGYYAEKLPAVEINNTSLRLPKQGLLDKWAQQVPYTFRFSVKAPQVITRQTEFDGLSEEIGSLLGSVKTLEHLLGAVLFQVPANTEKDLQLLKTFFETWPEDTPAAFEFRHQSWHDDEVYGCLRGRNAAFCNVDDNGFNDSLVSTADWGYVRMRAKKYDIATLQRRLADLQSQAWKRVYVFFRHEEDSKSPKFATQFLQLANEIN